MVEADPSWQRVLTDPAAWALLGYGALGLTVFAAALQRGSVTIAMAGQCAGETLLPAAIGVVMLGDAARSGAAPLAAVGFVIAVVAALSLVAGGDGEAAGERAGACGGHRVIPMRLRSTVGWLDLSPLGSGVEHGFDVQDGSRVERLEVPHEHPGPVDGEDRDAVQADRVGPVGCAGAEHACLGPGRVSARVHGQDVATGAVEPGQDEYVGAGPKVAETFGDTRVEHEVGVG
jgi:hypothetical protein